MGNIVFTVKYDIKIPPQIKSPSFKKLFKNPLLLHEQTYPSYHYIFRRDSCEFWVSNRYCIKRVLNKFKDWQLVMLRGSWFHNFGPITLKFLAPVSVVVLGIRRLSCCLVLTLFSRVSLIVGSGKTHSGRMLLILLYIKRHILYINLGFIFSHFSFSNIGETWSCFFAPPIAILAAKFNTFWARLIWVFVVDPHIR